MKNQMEGMILVKEIMRTDVKTIDPDATIMQTVVKMNKLSVGSLVVVTDKKPISILTKRDILRVVEEGLDLFEVKVSDEMSHPLITITEDADSMHAANLIVQKRVKKLPVIKQGELIGIVTTMDLVRSRPTLMKLLDAILKN